MEVIAHERGMATAQDGFGMLRGRLYELLKSVHGDEEEVKQNIAANQIAGINMTKAVQRDGVNVIQLQNIKAIGRVTGHAVDALRDLDRLETIFRKEVAVRALPPPVPEVNPYEALLVVCRAMVEGGLNLQAMARVFKHGAVLAALTKFKGDIDDTAEALGIGTGYVPNLRRVPLELQQLGWEPEDG